MAAIDKTAFDTNLDQIEAVVAEQAEPVIWAAWGQPVVHHGYFLKARDQLYERHFRGQQSVAAAASAFRKLRLELPKKSTAVMLGPTVDVCMREPGRCARLSKKQHRSKPSKNEVSAALCLRG